MGLPEPTIPDAEDQPATTRWLRDHPECTVVGTLEEGPLEPYLEGIEEGLRQWHATMHFMINQCYQDDVVRVGDGWKIIRRNTVKHFHRGPSPRPTIVPPSYPRPRPEAR